jgi:hypothetical protein
MKNTGSVAMPITYIVNGSNAGDFAIQGTTCPASGGGMIMEVSGEISGLKP